MERSRRSALILIIVGASPGVANGQTSETYVLIKGSTFQRGCFDPCNRPIGQEQSLAGTFSLVPRSDNGLFADYMVDVRGRVEGSAYATPPNAPIPGAGTYTVGGEFAVEQRMRAELLVADEAPVPFDGGRMIGGGGFPDQIGIEISENGKYCFGTVRHVVAQPLLEAVETLQLLAGLGGLLGTESWRSRRASSR